VSGDVRVYKNNRDEFEKESKWRLYERAANYTDKDLLSNDIVQSSHVALDTTRNDSCG
jgi:hypothetical protein